MRPGDVLTIRDGERLGILTYLGKHPRLGDAVWVIPSLLDGSTDPCTAAIGDGYMLFFPATTLVRQGIVKKAAYCPEALRLLPTATRGIVSVPSDGTVERWVIQEVDRRYAIDTLTPALRSLPIAEIWNYEFLLGRLREAWTPARYENAAREPKS